MQDWTKLLLDADPAELEGRGNSETARRIREDPQLRAEAARILGAMRELDAALHDRAVRASSAAAGRVAGASAGAAGADAALHAGSSVRSGARGPGGLTSGPVRTSARRGPAVGWTVAGTLAAAGLAAFLFWPHPLREADVPEPPLTSRLDAASDRPFAVLATQNPDIAIVWLLEEVP